MKKLLLMLMCFTLVFAASSCSKTNKYKVVVEQVNKQLPMDLQGGISLDKAEVEGDVFKYIYTFKEEPVMTTEDFISASKEAMIPMVKAKDELKVFRDDNMTIAFVYKKNDGSIYAEVQITPEDYK